MQRDSAITGRRSVWLGVAFLAALLSSCAHNSRKPVYPVRGQVLVNGKPAAGATVFFFPLESAPEAIAPYGVVDADGSFSLTTYLTFDGAPAGEYVVTVRWPAAAQRPGDDPGPDRLKGDYANPKTSKLRATVEKKANEIQAFQLTTK